VGYITERFVAFYKKDRIEKSKMDFVKKKVKKDSSKKTTGTVYCSRKQEKGVRVPRIVE
jgi:hypothetical protein